MGVLTIVGLGPAGPELLTREAHHLIAGADELYVRTRRHPTVAGLPFSGRLRSFDAVYRRGRALEEVYATIAERLVRLAGRPRGVLYAVPGHPLVGERTVQLALERAAAQGVETRVVAGLSFLEPALEAARLDPIAAGLQILDAASLVADHFDADGRRQPFAARSRWVDPTFPAVVAQVDSARLASGLKLALLQSYPPGHEVLLVRGGPPPAASRLALVDLDRAAVDHLTTVVLPPVPRLDDLGAFETLRYVVARLRAPGGCPWDREQTHESLRRELVEESYEVVDAIEAGAVSGDWAKLGEELGDVLMNLLLHVQIGSEAERFWLEDVLRAINAKLIRRHPHVFGDLSVSSTAEVLRNWDAIKRTEKGDRPEASRLGEAPASLPALMRAQALQRRARRTGFAWPTVDGVWAKVMEELAELRRAGTADERSEELGDVLWMVGELANWLEVDAEEALRNATTKFVGRFRAMERLASERGDRFEELGVDRQLDLWAAVKDAERATT
ncbi:MAG TPA: nucleoside triphosphate pyrophosphohydrolase [Chloroflexota bacterium]|nr:nucleoside triphosphate pyrophosphohydrolase [Chloroflexota bacterium]